MSISDLLTSYGPMLPRQGRFYCILAVLLASKHSIAHALVVIACKRKSLTYKKYGLHFGHYDEVRFRKYLGLLLHLE